MLIVPLHFVFSVLSTTVEKVAMSYFSPEIEISLNKATMFEEKRLGERKYFSSYSQIFFVNKLLKMNRKSIPTVIE